MQDSLIGEPTNCPKDFHRLLGIFHAGWCSSDIVVDYLISRLLGTKAEEAHLTLSGMMYGAKLRIARNLVYRSDHPKKKEIMTALNALQNSKRDVIAHSYIASDENRIMFIERSRGGDYKVKEHLFTASEFEAHVASFLESAQLLQNSVGASGVALVAFARSAFEANSK